MRSRVITVLCCLFFVSFCNGEVGVYSVKGEIANTENPSSLKVQLYGNQGKYSTIPREDGSFQITNVPSGAYYLDVTSLKYNFTTVRIDISAKHNGKIKARFINDTNEFIEYPLHLIPAFRYQFLQKRQPYDFFSVMKSFLFTGGIIVVLYFLIRNFDTEGAKELLRSMQEDEGKDKDKDKNNKKKD